MERLSGLDAAFLYVETPTVHMHTIKVVILDVDGVPGGFSFARLRQTILSRAPAVPELCCRIVQVPANLHHPVLVGVDRATLAAQMHHVRLRHPGDQDALEHFVGRVASRPLDRGRPLWELHVVEGLQSRRVAIVVKIHHALADGAAAAELLATFMRPRGEPTLSRTPRYRPERMPSTARLVVDALVDTMRLLARLPRLLVRTASALVRARATRRKLTTLPPTPFSGARTSLSRRVDSRRSFATVQLPLVDFKSVKNRLGCSMNDVLVAVTAGALRRYFQARGESVRQPIVTAVPIGIRHPHHAGNFVSNMLVEAPVHIDDPIERLRAVHRSASAAKLIHEQFGSDLMARWAELGRALPFRLLWRFVVPRLDRGPVAMIVSNVCGPDEALFAGAAELVDVYSVGPLLERANLNVTAWSYCGTMSISVLVCPRAVPEVRSIADRIPDSLAELVRACGATGSHDELRAC